DVLTEGQIQLWKGYIYAEFVAVVMSDAGVEVVARSKGFRMPKRGDSRQARECLDDLCMELRLAGWTLDSSEPGDSWYDHRFSRTEVTTWPEVPPESVPVLEPLAAAVPLELPAELQPERRPMPEIETVAPWSLREDEEPVSGLSEPVLVIAELPESPLAGP